MTPGYIWSRGLPWWLSGKEAAQEMLVRSVGQEDPLVEEIGNPLQYSCLENPMDRGAWWATVHGVTRESEITERQSTPLYVVRSVPISLKMKLLTHKHDKQGCTQLI